MSNAAVTLTLRKDRAESRIDATRVIFSPHQYFGHEGDIEEGECLRLLGDYLAGLPHVVLLGEGWLRDQLLQRAPALRGSARCAQGTDDLPSDAETVFLCETSAVERARLRKRLPAAVKVVEPTVLAELAPASIPVRGWVPHPRSIYPVDIPEIRVDHGIDLVLLDCPARNLALMPNGLAYVHNALKKTGIRHQVVDLDIVAYHRFHMHRLFDVGGRVTLPSGCVLPEDPWQAQHYDLWTTGNRGSATGGPTNELIEFFRPLMEETIAALVAAKPRIVGFSIQQCNQAISSEIAQALRARLPDALIVAGGFSCYQADIGLRAFPECDYMCIGEADLTVGPLVEALAKGDRPVDMPGVLSRFDTPQRRFIPAPMVHDLDRIEFPKYDWCDLSLYRNWNDYQLTPIIASRGCRWSRCTFCAERFYWRVRSAECFVDELEWLAARGCHLFMFNESDLNGMPERLLEICNEIIRRGLNRRVKLTGQLRIHKRSDRAFFATLREANFVALRFGVDAFSEKTLRLQKKGYTKDMVSQNLRDCWESGIYTEVNWVIGVPGETEADVDEGIEFILANRQHIGRVANINPLILVNGSVYWLDPAAHGIEFRESKEALFSRHPRALPADAWYSTDPYIDAQVRKRYFERVVVALHEAEFPVGAWANRVIEDVKQARDPSRSASVRIGRAAGTGGTPGAVAQPHEGDKTSGATGSPTRRTIDIKPTPTDSADPGGARPAPVLERARPRVIRETESHRIVEHDGWFFGVPRVLGEPDLGDHGWETSAAVVRHRTEEGLLALIDETGQWADARGQYESRDRQRAQGSYLRAASNLAGTDSTERLTGSQIVRRFDEFFAVQPSELRNAFAAAARDAGSPARPNARSVPVEVHGSTLRRRVANLLPASVLRSVRRLVRSQLLASRQDPATAARLTDAQLASVALRALFGVHVVRRLRRLIDRESRIKGAPVPGESFEIIGATTRNAVPELLCSVGRYNLVKFDGRVYGVPQGILVDWDRVDIEPERMVVKGRSIADVMAMIPDSDQGTQDRRSAPARETPAAGRIVDGVPRLLAVLGEYRLYAYEGWFYALPAALGEIDLVTVDVLEMPGVIRDVSRDAVEAEIRDRLAAMHVAA